MQELFMHYLQQESGAIISLVSEIIAQAHVHRASDIHIDPTQTQTVVRFRIDGILQSVCVLPKELHQELIARIKVLTGLRTDERFLPQDGRFTVNESLDIRITTVASYYGESVVIRLLERSMKKHSLTTLGFTQEQQRDISRILKYPSGLVLITGPTGSGKTTTLYTILMMLNRSTQSIVTIEDPIEYALDGIRQLQVHTKRGITFSSGLRSILRQDPDIIMIGEIRDEETATLAIQASLTGHLVISTLHTNSAPDTIIRLIDMGIEPYLISATVRLIVNQRLVRTVCKDCATRKTLSKYEHDFIKSIAQDSNMSEHVQSVGCAQCLGTGYKGRSVVAEVLKIDEAIKKCITTDISIEAVKNVAHRAGMIPMSVIGLTKCKEYATTIEEIARIHHQ